MAGRARLSADFASRLGAPAPAEPPDLVGLEHEYRTLRGGRPIDFSRLIHQLAIPGRRLDPGDVNAYRCPSGLSVTCDDAEAEIASPPIPLLADFAGAVDGWARFGREVLAGLLPPRVEAVGYSTHLSVSVRQPTEQLAEKYLRTFAPALMLLLDRADSHGIYVRCRPGRLEACGEYALGRHLRAAAAFFAGSVRASASGRPAPMPPELEVRVSPALGRHGAFLSRRAFGFDLYTEPRRAALRRTSGGAIRADDYVRVACESAAAALVRVGTGCDVDDLLAVAGGSLPLRVELDLPEESADAPAVERTIFGEILEASSRPGFALRAVTATWDFTVFRVEAGPARAFACVPARALGLFLGAVRAGALDGLLEAYLRSPPEGRLLASEEQTREPGLWDDVSPSPALVPAEHPPSAGAKSGRASAGRPGKPVPARPGRPGKPPSFPSDDDTEPTRMDAPGPRPGRRPPRRPVVLVALLLVLLAAIAFAVVASMGRPPPVPTRTPVRPTGVVESPTATPVQTVSAPPETAAPTPRRTATPRVTEPRPTPPPTPRPTPPRLTPTPAGETRPPTIRPTDASADTAATHPGRHLSPPPDAWGGSVGA